MAKVTLAVVGLTGQIGQHVLKAVTDAKFKDHYNFPIRAFTRDPSKYKSTETVEYYASGSFTDTAALEKSLEGVNTLIDLTNPSVDSKPLVDAAVKAGVKLFFPSEFGGDYDGKKFAAIFQAKGEIVAYARSKGLKTVLYRTGLFADWVINMPIVANAFGIDRENNVYRKIGSGDRKVSVSFLRDIGYGLVSVAYRDPSFLPNELRVQSDSITANQLAAIYEKATGVKLTVENVTEEESIKESEEAFKNIATGGFPAFITVIRAYGQTSVGGVDFSQNNANQLVNPGTFEWTSFAPEAEKIWSEKK